MDLVPGLSFELWIGLMIACVALAATPGPSMSLFMANTTSYGTRAGLLTVAGNTIGVSILVATATIGLTSVMALVSEWFEVIRWIGVAYLIYLGVQKLLSATRSAGVPVQVQPSAHWIIPQALLVALSNPKVLLFLGAFFPQFLDLSSPAAPQLAVLAISFVLAIALTDAALVLVAARARILLTRKGSRAADAVSGIILLGGGALLASIRR